MSFGPTGIYIHTNSDSASIPAATASQESSLRNRIIPSFATTTARDGAYTGLTSDQKQGIHAWIVNREGLSYWDPTANAWAWKPEQRILFLGSRTTPADTGATSAGTAVPIILAAAKNLPPGNRLVEIHASVNMDNLSTTVAAAPRAYVTGFAVADGDNWMQAWMGAADGTETRSRSWLVVASGTLAINLYGLNAVGGGATVRFNHAFLSVIDRGPTDG